MMTNTNRRRPMNAYEAQEAALIGCARNRVAEAVSASVLGESALLLSADAREHRHLTEILEAEADYGATVMARGVRYSGSAAGGWSVFLAS